MGVRRGSSSTTVAETVCNDIVRLATQRVEPPCRGITAGRPLPVPKAKSVSARERLSSTIAFFSAISSSRSVALREYMDGSGDNIHDPAQREATAHLMGTPYTRPKLVRAIVGTIFRGACVGTTVETQ